MALCNTAYSSCNLSVYLLKEQAFRKKLPGIYCRQLLFASLIFLYHLQFLKHLNTLIFRFESWIFLPVARLRLEETESVHSKPLLSKDCFLFGFYKIAC